MRDQKPPSACVGDELEQCICASVHRLRAGYVDDGRDRADSLLRNYPDSTRIVEALRTLIDALFPGRCFPAD